MKNKNLQTPCTDPPVYQGSMRNEQTNHRQKYLCKNVRDKPYYLINKKNFNNFSVVTYLRLLTHVIDK